MLDMFAIQHIGIWPNFILIVVKIQQKQALSSNAYDDVTDFAIRRFHKNTKTCKSRETLFFFKSKK